MRDNPRRFREAKAPRSKRFFDNEYPPRAPTKWVSTRNSTVFFLMGHELIANFIHELARMYFESRRFAPFSLSIRGLLERVRSNLTVLIRGFFQKNSRHNARLRRSYSLTPGNIARKMVAPAFRCKLSFVRFGPGATSYVTDFFFRPGSLAPIAQFLFRAACGRRSRRIFAGACPRRAPRNLRSDCALDVAVFIAFFFATSAS